MEEIPVNHTVLGMLPDEDSLIDQHLSMVSVVLAVVCEILKTVFLNMFNTLVKAYEWFSLENVLKSLDNIVVSLPTKLRDTCEQFHVPLHIVVAIFSATFVICSLISANGYKLLLIVPLVKTFKALAQQRMNGDMWPVV